MVMLCYCRRHRRSSGVRQWTRGDGQVIPGQILWRYGLDSLRTCWKGCQVVPMMCETPWKIKNSMKIYRLSCTRLERNHEWLWLTLLLYLFFASLTCNNKRLNDFSENVRPASHRSLLWNQVALVCNGTEMDIFCTCWVSLRMNHIHRNMDSYFRIAWAWLLVIC